MLKHDLRSVDDMNGNITSEIAAVPPAMLPATFADLKLRIDLNILAEGYPSYLHIYQNMYYQSFVFVGKFLRDL